MMTWLINAPNVSIYLFHWKDEVLSKRPRQQESLQPESNFLETQLTSTICFSVPVHICIEQNAFWQRQTFSYYNLLTIMEGLVSARTIHLLRMKQPSYTM